MCIQRKKAEEKNIEFKVSYINFSDPGDDEGDLNSTIIKTDE